MFTTIEVDKTKQGPLHGIKVIDLSRLVAGNTLTMCLADFGADVLKVEPKAGDILRDWKVEGLSTAWKTYCRNKQSLCIDFRARGAIDVVLKLIEDAHIFVESFRPGTLEEMGLSPEILFSRNPKLVIVRISGYGQTGPYSHRPGFGTLIEGMSGFASMNGFADREPVLPPIYLADMTAGLYGVYGVMIALRQVEVSGGQGQVIDLPLLDPLFSILGAQAANFRLTGKPKQRTGSRSTNSGPRNVYQTKDSKWVALSASAQSMAERLFRSVGREDLIHDHRFKTNADRIKNADELDEIIGSFIAQMDQQECVNYFDKASVTIGPVYDMEQIEKDPHFLARDIVVELPDDQMGTVPVHNISPQLEATPGSFRCRAPDLGQHSCAALRAAGYSETEIASLLQQEIVFNGSQESV